MDYLKRAHTYFLDFNLPAMRRKLIEAIDCSRDNDVAYLILKFFDEYAKEVRRHMEYENEAVFTYVEQLLQGRLSDEYDIATFASKHNQIDTKLKELKNIIIKYYPEKENNNLPERRPVRTSSTANRILLHIVRWKIICLFLQ